MERFTPAAMKEMLVTYGRTLYEKQDDILWFDWTASTVEFTFCGTHLNASFRAENGEEIEGIPTDPNAPRRKTWPWVAVYLDDMTTPIRKFEVASPNETWLLYQSAEPQTHRIRLTKLTENSKSFLGITAMTMEGSLLPTEKKHRKRVEFVGDSITCGYGNLSKDRDRTFWSDEEDGAMAYGPRAARMLDLEYSIVSISGITAVEHEGWPGEYPMCELYRYTDKVLQARHGSEPEEFDFAANHNDVVVLNLGTNDNYACLFSPNPTEEAEFAGRYIRFVKEIRALNGPETRIVCALGTMSYYLWDNIRDVVEAYKAESGDANIFTFKFRPIHPMDGFGAAGHPSMATHEKMSKEIAAFLKTIV